MNRQLRIGSYVYDITDNQRHNLLVLKITAKELFVYCMRRNDKFWLNKVWARLTPVPWKDNE